MSWEWLFWILLLCSSSIFAFLHSANPITLAIVCGALVLGIIGHKALSIADSFLKMQKQRLETEKERLRLEQQRTDAIMELDQLSDQEKWKNLM